MNYSHLFNESGANEVSKEADDGFCGYCRDAVTVMECFDGTVKTKKGPWDVRQGEAARSLIRKLGGVDKARNLASFVVNLKLQDKPLIPTPEAMLNNLTCLLSIYKNTQGKNEVVD